jgi:DNA (cytosine-5)-methyltransferase 1
MENGVLLMTSPTPEQIRQVRELAGLSQTQAAAIVHASLRTWQHWEAGDRVMHPAFWDLFNIKQTGVKKNEDYR